MESNLKQSKEEYNKGWDLEEQGKYEQALEHFKLAIYYQKNYYDAWFQKGLCESQLQQYQQAIESLDQAIILQPNDKYAYNNKGNALKALGQYQQAIECYNKAIELDQNNSYYWNNKGNALKALGQYQQAIECFNKAIELDQNDSYYWNNKGNALKALGQYQQAIECFNKAIELDQNYANAWNNKGDALDSLGQYQQAIECYNKAIELDQNNSYYWNNKGNALKALGQYQQAIECFNKAIELDQNDSYYWNNKGNALKALGQYQQAIECFNKAIELDQNYANAWNNKGDALDSLGQYQQAIECFNKAIELDQNDSYYWNNKGNALKALGQYQQAIECYQKAIKLNPTDYKYFNQGLLFEKLNRNEEAMQSYKEALKLNPNEQDAKKHLSDLESKYDFKFLKQYSGSEQKKVNLNIQLFEFEQIAEQFFAKLNQDQAQCWIQIFKQLPNEKINEICNYYSYIQPYLIFSDEASKIQKENNFIIGGFGIIQYGIFREEAIIIKEQQPKQSDELNVFIQILREIAILIYCNHPNIQKIIAVHFNPNELKVQTIQEKYSIDLLKAVIENKCIIPKKKDLIIQLLDALNYIHEHGIIHLDLKLNNIIFKSQKYKKLILLDFGISKIQKNSLTQYQGLSPQYAAPEIVMDNDFSATSKADIFSFGIVLYEFITARKAWKNYYGKAEQIYNLIRSGFDFFKENQSTGNNDLDKLILECVQQDPNKRPSTKEILERIKAIQI